MYTLYRVPSSLDTGMILPAAVETGACVVQMMSGCDVREPAAGVELWNSLRVMEHTPALKYQWQHSRCSDLLLHAIDIDARNIVC